MTFVSYYTLSYQDNPAYPIFQHISNDNKELNGN